MHAQTNTDTAKEIKLTLVPDVFNKCRFFALVKHI